MPTRTGPFDLDRNAARRMAVHPDRVGHAPARDVAEGSVLATHHGWLDLA
jgi:hypothetical protein